MLAIRCPRCRRTQPITEKDLGGRVTCQHCGQEVEAAHRLYQKNGITQRDDAIAMQYLIPGWRFDNKRPCMVR
jgi:uncharacterized Zn finger protein (UPF0148 family)